MPYIRDTFQRVVTIVMTAVFLGRYLFRAFATEMLHWLALRPGASPCVKKIARHPAFSAIEVHQRLWPCRAALQHLSFGT